MATSKKVKLETKICFVTGTFPPVRCGIGDYTARLVETLAEISSSQNIAISVLTSNQARAQTKLKFKLAGLVQRWDWANLRQVLRWLACTKPALIHFQYPTALYGRHPAITVLPFLSRVQALVKLQRPPVGVLTVHEYSTFRSLGKIRIWLMALACQAIVSVNPATLHDLRALKILGKKLQYIPLSSNISNTTPLEYTANPSEWRQEHGVATDRPVIAYFGYISENKGLHTLLEAVAELKEAYQLLLIAEPKAQDPNYQAYFDRLAAQIENLNLTQRVHWTGFASDTEVAAYLQSATVAVLPFVDGVSLRRTSLMAALANATPVISTQPTDLSEGQSPAQSLVSGENIWLVPPENPQTLTTAIQHLLQNPALRQQLAENGQEFAQKFSWPTIAAQHLELYKHYLR